MFNVILATDDSASSIRTARHVVAMAKHIDALEVRLINVQPPLSNRVGWGGSIIAAPGRQRQHKSGAKALARCAALLDRAGIPYHPQVFAGDPARTIVQQAKRARGDLIVMGTRGSGAIAKLLLGSVANKVIHLAPVPVTLVK